MRIPIAFALSALCVLTPGLLVFDAARAEDSAPALRPVPSIDLDRYAGRWYEVARTYNRWQKQCAGEVMVRYTPRPDGRLDVYNQCSEEDGDVRAVSGVARIAGDMASTLEVRFAPAWLSFLPVVWADYWVIDLADDYSWAAVGQPSRKYFWILSRKPQLDEAIVQGIVERAERQGYSLSELIRTRQERYPDVRKGQLSSAEQSSSPPAALE